MLEWMRFALCALCAAFGLFCLISGVLGVFRFRFSLNRIHAAALIDTVGLLFMTLSVIIAVGIDLTSLKLILIVLFQWLTSPVATHLIGKLEATTVEEPEKYMVVEDRELLERMKEGH